MEQEKKSSKIYTSYFAKVSKIDTSEYCLCAITRSRIPTWFQKEAIWRKDLAPSWDLLNDYKEGKVSWSEYTERYKAEMNLPARAGQIRENLEALSELKGKPVVLLCYEKDVCHRFILGMYIGAEELS